MIGMKRSPGLFANREVPVESLLFCPLDLVFGHDVKGVLQLVKQNWLKDDIIDFSQLM